MTGLRVISGVAKGRRLKMVPGASTRPITDRAKEALFGFLGDDIRDSRFLDLFAGTGSVGIEALSRGAAFATFVDIDARAIRTIRENLALTGLSRLAEIIREDAFRFLSRQTEPAYDYVYIAPPQYEGIWGRAVLALDRDPRCLHPDAMVIAQLHPQESHQLALTHLGEADRRKYGSTLLLFLELTSA